MFQKNVFLAIKVSFVVGTILIFINNFEMLFEHEFTTKNIITSALNYIVPFFVSLYSSGTFKKQK